MLVYRYTKTDGAEFISHLDTLRHIQKTLNRAKIEVGYSQGFNPHILAFMSSPIACGLKSVSEYCSVETDEPIETFIEKYNANTPRGIICLGAKRFEKDVNLASALTKAEYEITGINKFDVREFLQAEEIWIVDKKGKEREVRKKILSLDFRSDGVLNAVLRFGNDALRPDIFCEKLKTLYGGEHISVIKTEAYTENDEILIKK